MNISQMMRSFLGEASSTDTRAVELKVGQIVRGVILQVMENNEALVQINGVQVRAKLEQPLQAGQTAMLQVQPQSSGALVMLKQVEPGQVGLPEDTFKEWAKQLALPEQKWAVQLVKELRKEGVILNREVAQAFQQAASAMPAGGDAEQWMQAASAAFKRGLPMTGGAVGAMQQVMFGKSAHELLDTLQQQLSTLSISKADGPETENKPINHAAVRVQALLSEGMELLRGAATAIVAASSDGDAGKEAAAAKPQNMPNVKQDTQQESAAKMNTVEESSADKGLPQTVKPAANQPNWLGQMMKWMGVDHELQLAKSLTSDPQPNQPVQSTPPSSTQSASSGDTSVKQPLLAHNPPVTPNNQPEGAIKQGTVPTADVEQAVKLEFTESEEQRPVRVQDYRQGIERAAGLVAAGIADSIQSPDPAPAVQHESLKSALLALVSADNTPPAVKETAQQLVQQITGQQLLLTPERNNSVLTHVTMFIPLNSADGKQTASVHIQTRRGSKGELDSSNCRLLFNLSMNTLGDTMVDVNVIDKIVSLNLWNDHPAISALAESSRTEIACSLQAAGYQLLSLRTTPLPKASDNKGEEASPTALAPKNQQMTDMSAFSANRYKGVDYRI